ncbi:chemotaxis protein CheB [Marinivivus vitaminiproducens]|uniref:chemotaxis protein CheB n=1 Tax=Marinivivus vitaminiproducens TaxID=3035935 RepID=UPI0027A6CC83|nr:chemotaxis protein CheB [Geminicoccaceae bacterium SCSIO 64248]
MTSDHQPDPAIVGIGASAGGVAVLQQLFEMLPTDTGAAFVVILHLDPTKPSELSNVLAQRTSMPVQQVETEFDLVANHVYVIPPDRRLSLADHRVSALPFDEARNQRHPIDLFFRSVAEHHNDSIAVVLSGGGSDGAIGIRAVKEAGGFVLVQDPNDAEFASMPRSAIATEMADVVLPLNGLAERLTDLLRGTGKADHLKEQDGDEIVMRRILAHLHKANGHDFSKYKRATIRRRIVRRMQITHSATLDAYHRYLLRNVEEAQSLFKDFLITVTAFFRDRESYAALERQVIPKLFETEGNAPIRIWVPGCATGEEAYSLGILLLEEATRQEAQQEIQIFGSDLDPGALAIAREGRFPLAIEADVSEERLARFFIREGDHYRVRRELRDILLFASHSLIKDPPFSRLDLISCRNLLIYLDREAQAQVCAIFHYGLRSAGYLFLGAAEHAEQPSHLFQTLDRKAKIYSAVRGRQSEPPTLPMRVSLPEVPIPRPSAPPQTSSEFQIHRQALEDLAPPSILVDHTHRVLHLSPTAGRYLQPAGGPFSADVIDLARREFQFDLRAALHRVFERGEATLSVRTAVQFNGTPHWVYFQVRPVRPERDEPIRHALILFVEGDAAEADASTPGQAVNDGEGADRIRRLEEELHLTHARLQSVRQEATSATEELRAANEELQSINEEYRSTSEELETSKEELQSINEELQTVNHELQLKLETISRAHNDLQNLMAAADYGTLFLDAELQIKRFTPRLTSLFNITQSDIGRSITDFTHHLHYDGLPDQAREVLRELVPVEHEVEDRRGRWYLVRLRPYRTTDDMIDGVVATFVDITERRKIEEALRESEERLQRQTRLVELSRSPIFAWDFDGGIIEWNRGSEELYGYGHDEVLGQNKLQLLRTKVPGSSFEALRQGLRDNGMWHGEVEHRTKDGRTLIVESHLELVTMGHHRLVLESTRDITDQKRWAEQQKLLLNELSHRVKNILTVVVALSRQTFRPLGPENGLLLRFEGRLIALSEAHALLVDSKWQGAELKTLIDRQLKMHSAPGRVVSDGTRVVLPPNLATPFGLLLHELATNAVKYGALSNDRGRVHLGWRLNDRNDPPVLTLKWEERDGPPVDAPSRTGVGTRLIQSGLPSATVHHAFEQQGVICTIELPLKEETMHGAAT